MKRETSQTTKASYMPSTHATRSVVAGSHDRQTDPLHASPSHADDVMLSILIPVYNVERYLRQCLDTIRRQSFTNFEVIAVNDGSSDGCGEILGEYAKRDPRFSVIDKTNTGYGDSMNCALLRAKGHYIGIVEPDDYIDTDMYQSYIEAALTHDADVVKSNYYEHKGIRDKKLDLFSEFGIAYNEVFDPAEHPLLITVRPSIWAGIYRRDFLEKNNICFATTPGASFQDTSFCHMTWISARRAVVLSEAFLHYRIDNEAASSHSGKKVKAVFKEFKRSFKYLQDCPKRLFKTFGPVLGAVSYGNYLWNYNRVESSHRLEFAERWSKEMIKLEEKHLIDYDLLSGAMCDDLCLLMANHATFAKRYEQGVMWQDFDYKRSGVTSAGTTMKTADFYLASKKPKDPKISVIVPVYRVESYIRECIESLLAQTFHNFEVICINDGSPDASFELARTAARRDARFVFIEQAQAGQSAARNKGIDEARGKYLLFLDADDLYVPTTLEQLYRKAQADKLDYLDFTARTFYEKPNLRKVNNEDYYMQSADIDGVMSGKDLFVEYMANDQYHCSLCLHFFKRKLLKDNDLRFKEGIIHEDELFSPLLISHAKRAAFINEQLYLRRVRPHSTMTRTHGLYNVVCLIKVVDALKDFLRVELKKRKVSRDFILAMTDRIALLQAFIVDNAAQTPEEELAAYEEQLEGQELIEFELYVRGGLAIRDQIDSKINRAYLAIKKSLFA